MKCIEKAITWVVKNWDQVPDSGYPNPADLLVVAHIIKSTCKTNLADYNLGVDGGRELISAIGDYMFDPLRLRIRGGELLIRRRPVLQLREEMQTNGEMLSEQTQSLGTGDLPLLKALFLVASFHTMSRI